MTQLTEHFSREELIASKRANQLKLVNLPTMAALKNLQKLANGLEAVRQLLRLPRLVRETRPGHRVAPVSRGPALGRPTRIPSHPAARPSGIGVVP